VRGIIASVVVLNLLALAVSAVAAFVLEIRSAAELLDLATYVGLGMGALGALMFVGSTSGSSASTGMAASAADRPSRIMDALWMDRNSGISTAAVFVLGGVSWLLIAWTLAALAGFQTLL
jgi:hypothetical protein